jgi:transmembrane sensor
VIPQKQTAKSVDEQAAEWAARVDAGALGIEEQGALEAWLAGDVRRAGAFARARALLAAVELGAVGEPRQPAKGAVASRRALLAASVAGLGGGVVMTRFAAPASAATRRFQSELGEIRALPAEDGTRIILSSQSALTVVGRPDRRLVQMERGEAFFEVAKIPGRPLVVSAALAQVRAVAAAFSVRLHEEEGGLMRVLVAAGQVSIERRSPTSGQAGAWLGLFGRDDAAGALVDLDAGQQAEIRRVESGDDSGRLLVQVSEASAEVVQRALLWREGRLAFEGCTLAEAAAEFARFSPHRIVVDSPALARQHVSGLFSATDPLGFSKAAATALNAKSRLRNNDIVIYK